jgi:hypothetical protein
MPCDYTCILYLYAWYSLNAFAPVYLVQSIDTPNKHAYCTVYMHYRHQACLVQSTRIHPSMPSKVYMNSAPLCLLQATCIPQYRT